MADLDGTSGARPFAGSADADRISAVVIGGGCLVVALVLAATTSSMHGFQWSALVLLMGVYVLAYRTEYVHTEGSSVPTEPVLVAMLFVVPVTVVPLAVLIAQFAAGLPRGTDFASTSREVGVRLISGWHSVGPVLVLLAAGSDRPDLSRWAVYVAALAAQFAFDLLSALAREWAIGGALRPMFRPLIWTFGVDALLAVIGWCAVVAGAGGLLTVALVAVPAGLIALLIHDRRGLAAQGADLGLAVANAREEARIDPLTGLGNRRAWYEATAAAAAQIDLVGSSVVAGLVAADLNHLKHANDSLGHEVGDELLQAMADVIRSVAPPGATLCRVGGDEFAILVLGTATTLDLPGLVVQLRTAVAQQAPISGIRLSVALGTAQCPPEPTLADAFRTADGAVFAEKRARRTSRGSRVPPPAQRVSPELGIVYD